MLEPGSPWTSAELRADLELLIGETRVARFAQQRDEAVVAGKMQRADGDEHAALLEQRLGGGAHLLVALDQQLLLEAGEGLIADAGLCAPARSGTASPR